MSRLEFPGRITECSLRHYTGLGPRQMYRDINKYFRPSRRKVTRRCISTVFSKGCKIMANSDSYTSG